MRMQDRIWPSTEAENDFGAASVPGRMGTPEEMARVVAFLASEDSSLVSGH
jgi:NAD(P)-dependent dehydrogenase (short-subunit alcohol dehydrogenase family)